MEANDITENVINNEKPSEGNNESIDEQKKRLKQQIDELRSIILQMEWGMDVFEFRKTKCVLRSKATKGLGIDEIPDVNVQLESHLYRFSGFYCIKFSKNEYVFNFSSLHKYDKKNIFAIQILNSQDKVALGNWIMPKSIDLNDLVSQISITELRNVPRFLRACKHYIDCYFIRHEQYDKLTDAISCIKNGSSQTNSGYTQVTLSLMGVYDKNDDSHMNLIIYLLYNIGETRPYKIEVDSATEDELNRDTKKHLEACLGCFKKLDLHVAFEKMLNKEPFIWSKEEDEDSPLEINTLSDSDETGLLENFSVEHEKTLSLQKNRTKIKKIWKRRTRKENLINLSSASKHNKKSVSFPNKKRTVKNVDLHSAQQENSGILGRTSNVNDPKQKILKQTRLKFQLSNSKLQNSSDTMRSEATSSKRKEIDKQPHKPFTSTPIRYNKQHSSNIAASTNIDISDITVSDNNSDNTRAKGNVNTVEENKLKAKKQLESNTPVKLIEDKMKRKIKSVQSKSQSTKQSVSRKKKKINKSP